MYMEVDAVIHIIFTSGVGRGGGKGPGCGFKFAGSSSRTRSHIFSGSAALKTIRSRMLNYGNYHGKCMIINTNSPRYNRQLYDYGVFIRPPKYKYLCLPLPNKYINV